MADDDPPRARSASWILLLAAGALLAWLAMLWFMFGDVL